MLRIYAEPYAGNRGSARVLEKAGFAYEGCLRANVYKNGQVRDQLIAKLNPHGNESVLDIGCGDGKVSARLARGVPCSRAPAYGRVAGSSSRWAAAATPT